MEWLRQAEPRLKAETDITLVGQSMSKVQVLQTVHPLQMAMKHVANRTSQCWQCVEPTEIDIVID